ncbi:hypothetical protein [Chitinophaga barathri]|uniref:Uncharacterized protein n=1 Tax=Chitinophaga barathri TaxID=1647451 RepID=A0A3N4ML52_9BACT|nr:hypothetical protein [Chitinophaga barathri]RPD42776.1 hypothetical protein EG028_00310 [Chitinophaga barathri]
MAFLCSILLFAKGVGNGYRLFFLYTLFVIIIEFTGRWMAEAKIPNHRLFTFACFVFTCFYLYTVRSFLADVRRRRAVLLLLGLFVAVYIVNLSFFQGLTAFNSYSFIIGYTLLAIACTIYYIEFIQQEVITPVWEEPDFFIVTGYFIYGAITAILYTLHRYFAYMQIPDVEYRSLFRKTSDIANVSLYLLLAVAFVIIWKKRKS